MKKTSNIIKFEGNLNRILFPKYPEVLGKDNDFGIVSWNPVNVLEGEPIIDSWGSLIVKGIYSEELDYHKDYTIIAKEIYDEQRGTQYELMFIGESLDLSKVKNQRGFLKSFLTDGQVDEMFKVLSNPLEAIENHDIAALKQKIINAVNKSAGRVPCTLSANDYGNICNKVFEEIESENFDNEEIPVKFIHSVVEHTLLDLYPDVGYQYQQYRNYKMDFVHMMDEVYEKSQSVRYIGDVSNANSDASMVSTQRSIIYGELNKALYKKFFLNKEELQASNDGYIYIHDMKDRLDSVNCMLFNMGDVIKDGFEMGNIWYNEPKTVDVAFDVISDVAMAAASQQYGGFTIPQVDKILAPYAKKSYKKYFDEFYNIVHTVDKMNNVCLLDYDSKAKEYAIKKVERDLEQGFQAWEYSEMEGFIKPESH